MIPASPRWLLLLVAAGMVPSSTALHGCPKRNLSTSKNVDMNVCNAKGTVVIHDNLQIQSGSDLGSTSATSGACSGVNNGGIGGALGHSPCEAVQAPPVSEILQQCRFKPDQYRGEVCTEANLANWKSRAAAGIPPNHAKAKCSTSQKPGDADTTLIDCGLDFDCEGQKSMCSLVQEECHNWQYPCGECSPLQQVSCCDQCRQVKEEAAQGTLKIQNKAVDNVECYENTSCSEVTLQKIVGDHQDVCSHDAVTGVFSCQVSVQCEVGNGKSFSEDASWQCMATPCNECCTEECRAQCCDKCLTQVCSGAQDGEPHYRRVCLGCDYSDSELPKWDLPPYHKTEFKDASLLIKDIETTDNFDVATCKELVAPFPPKGTKLDEEEELCRLSVADYTKSELCTDLLGKWREICGLPIDGDACALGGDLKMGCSTDWSCKGGDVLCSLYEKRYDTLAFDCTKCTDPLKFSCCQECFEVMDKQEFDEKHKRGVTCTGCSREELAAVKSAQFESAGQIKVDADAATAQCKYGDTCTVGEVQAKVEDASWKCLVTPCDACGDNMTAKALCCVECLSQTCASNGKDGVRHVCSGCDELPKSTVTTTFMPGGSHITTPTPTVKVQNVNVSGNVSMDICRSPNTTNLSVAVVIHGEPIEDKTQARDVENCTTSPQLQCPTVESLLATWKKNYNTLRHDLDACSVNVKTGLIECKTERKCEGGHSYCFLAEVGSASITYDCESQDISKLQRHSCCATCSDAVDLVAEGKLKDNEGHNYNSVTCKGCTKDDLSGITDKSCSAAAAGDHCTVGESTGDFTCSFHEAYATGTKSMHTEDLSWQCTTTPCDVCSTGEESQAENDRLRSQCCVNCLTAAKSTCANNRTRNICQGCQEAEATRIYETTTKSKVAKKAADVGFLGLTKASSTWAVAGFAGLFAFALATVAAVVRRFPDAGSQREDGVQNFAREEYSRVSTDGAVE